MTSSLQVSTRQGSQIAPYRNPGQPENGLPTGQGLIGAGVIVGGYVQSLSQTAPGSWSAPNIFGSTQYPAVQIVAANAPPIPGSDGPAVNSVNLFWTTGSGVMTTNLTSPTAWAEPQSVAGVPNLLWLQVAYTPAGNPVVYGVDSSGADANLWTYKWSNGPGGGWSLTEYPSADMQWGGAPQGLSLLAQSETGWVVFANSTTANNLEAVQGTFGDQGGQTVTAIGEPTAGAFQWIVGGGVSTAQPSTTDPNWQQSVPCVFYVDPSMDLMMFPSTLNEDVAVPVVNAQAAYHNEFGNFPSIVTVNAYPNPTASGLSAAGSTTTIYQVDGSSNVYALRQVAWVFDNRLPTFSPPTLIVAEGSLPLPAIGLAADLRPADLPAVFIFDLEGNVYAYELCRPGTYSVTWNGTSASGLWAGAQVFV